jgi:hypothetical protein
MTNLFIPVLFNHFQVSGNGWQTKSTTVVFIYPEDEHYYQNEQNCLLGHSGALYNLDLPQDILRLVETCQASLDWEETTDTTTGESTELFSVRVGNRAIWWSN